MAGCGPTLVLHPACPAVHRARTFVRLPWLCLLLVASRHTTVHPLFCATKTKPSEFAMCPLPPPTPPRRPPCRYGDLLAHWQLKAALRGEQPPLGADALSDTMDGVTATQQASRPPCLAAQERFARSHRVSAACASSPPRRHSTAALWRPCPPPIAPSKLRHRLQTIPDLLPYLHTPGSNPHPPTPPDPYLRSPPPPPPHTPRTPPPQTTTSPVPSPLYTPLQRLTKLERETESYWVAEYFRQIAE